jgi:nitric oxide reductase NorD protein
MALLDWEEGLFNGLRALHARVVLRPRQRARAAVAAHLGDLRGPLFLFAQMLAGRPVALFETPNRVLCDAERIFLPPSFSRAGQTDANVDFYWLKTALGALALRRRPAAAPTAELAALLVDDLAALPGLVLLLERLGAELGAESLWQHLGLPLPGSASGDATPADPLLRDSPVPDAAPRDEITEVDGKGQTGVEVRDGDDDQPPQADMPFHTFEKVEALEEYTGLPRRTDDDDELDEHREALREVDMKHVVRTRERPHSIYRSDIVLDGLGLEVGGAGPADGIPYPEWNYRTRTYRDGWCRVAETESDASDAAWVHAVERRHRGLVLDLKKRFAATANEWLAQRRQPYGPELDLDAVVAAEVERRIGHTPDERWYVDRHRSLHDVAALILLDQSLSTDAWLDNARVLDTVRETIFCVGEVLDDFVDHFAVAAFQSNTRRHCGFRWLKRFDARWSKTRGRLGALQAEGYTRIGPALRHAHECLGRIDAARRIVILVTDGRPCDYDRYEGEYGIRDVARAIDVGRNHGIATHAFAIDRRAREHFPRMFRDRSYHVVPQPRALVRNMCDLFLRLEAG